MVEPGFEPRFAWLPQPELLATTQYGSRKYLLDEQRGGWMVNSSSLLFCFHETNMSNMFKFFNYWVKLLQSVAPVESRFHKDYETSIFLVTIHVSCTRQGNLFTKVMMTCNWKSANKEMTALSSVFTGRCKVSVLGCIMTPRRDRVLILGRCKCHLKRKKRLLREIWLRKIILDNTGGPYM